MAPNAQEVQGLARIIPGFGLPEMIIYNIYLI